MHNRDMGQVIDWGITHLSEDRRVLKLTFQLFALS